MKQQPSKENRSSKKIAAADKSAEVQMDQQVIRQVAQMAQQEMQMAQQEAQRDQQVV